MIITLRKNIAQDRINIIFIIIIITNRQDLKRTVLFVNNDIQTLHGCHMSAQLTSPNASMST